MRQKKLERFIADMGDPQILVSDGAGEYIGQDFKEFVGNKKKDWKHRLLRPLKRTER